MNGGKNCQYELSTSLRYTVMSGTPEKILEHMLETIKLESNGTDFPGKAELV